MLTRLTIELSEKERAALQRQAERDLRGLREQARYLIIRGLAAEIAEQAGKGNSTNEPASTVRSGNPPAMESDEVACVNQAT